MIVDGIKLLEMIRDNELKINSELKDKFGNKYIYKFDVLTGYTLFQIEPEGESVPDYSLFTDDDNEFEIIEKEQRINIQAIEEIMFKREVNDTEMYLGDKIDELIKAIKQLDKKIKE